MKKRIIVTEQMHKYRLTLRELWNRCYWSSARNRTEFWMLESFNAIKASLLEFIVTDSVQLYMSEDVCEFDSSLYVVPGYASQDMNARKAAIVFMAGNHYEYDTRFPTVLSALDVRLKLLDVADLHEMFWMDLRYYKCLIEECISRPDLVGQECLMDSILCEIELEVSY